MSNLSPVLIERARPFRVTAVIVLYRTAPRQSPAFQSVMAARAAGSAGSHDVDILLWDNSPDPANSEELPDGVHYFADANNSGLATAYNRAIEWSVQRGAEWLLTLDQDTAVPADFFEKMAAAARESSRYAGIGAIVPQIVADGKRLSPNYFQFGAIPRWHPTGYVGVARELVFAFNSGALLKVAALEQVGGYDPRFWLDNSDAMIFSRLHEYGKRVYVAGDIQLQHEFSMKDMQRRMSPERYRNALMAETAFWDLRMNRAAGWERTLRLALRLIKQWRRKDPAGLRQITRQALARRLFTSRHRRVEEWMELTVDRVRAETVSRALRISACMASYNGGAFVESQLESILSQLGPEDEVLIMDDGSTDDTVERIARFGDPRICLLRHKKNAGIAATFEDALRSASGDILFLCDDDDLWAPAKVQRFMSVFANRPEVEIVLSRVKLIDENDRPLPDSRMNRQGKFLPGFWRNLYMNHYQGSAMAVRASLLGRVLPFPARKTFLHDAWIGTRNELLGGKVAFIDEDLLLYRRHHTNASRTKPLLQQVQTRIDLLLAHLACAFRSMPKPSGTSLSRQPER